MSTWMPSTFSNIAEIIMGQSPNGKACNQSGNGKPLLNGPTEFGVKNPSPVQFTTEPTKIANPGDILFCVRGSTTGRMNWADQEYVIGRGLAAIRHRNGKEYQYFAKGLVDYNLPTLLASATGSTFPNVSRDQIENIEILVPPLPEQRSIAGVLSSLDDKIDFLHRQNRTLEAMAETLFRQKFVEEVNESDEFSKISDWVEFNPTRKLSKGTMAPYLEMSELSTSTFMPESWYEREFSSGTKFENGDTLLARITPCLENGKAAFITFLKEGEVAWGSTEYIVMRPKKGIHPLFAYSLARNQDFRDYAIGCLEGSSGRQRVNVDHLCNYQLLGARKDTVEIFNQLAGSIVPKMRLNSFEIRSLTKLRDTLLPKLMTGEIRVAG